MVLFLCYGLKHVDRTQLWCQYDFLRSHKLCLHTKSCRRVWNSQTFQWRQLCHQELSVQQVLTIWLRLSARYKTCHFLKGKERPVFERNAGICFSSPFVSFFFYKERREGITVVLVSLQTDREFQWGLCNKWASVCQTFTRLICIIVKWHFTSCCVCNLFRMADVVIYYAKQGILWHFSTSQSSLLQVFR